MILVSYYFAESHKLNMPARSNIKENRWLSCLRQIKRRGSNFEFPISVFFLIYIAKETIHYMHHQCIVYVNPESKLLIVLHPARINLLQAMNKWPATKPLEFQACSNSHKQSPSRHHTMFFGEKILYDMQIMVSRNGIGPHINWAKTNMISHCSQVSVYWSYQHDSIFRSKK